MEPIGYDVARDRNGPTRSVASASAFPPPSAPSSHPATPRVRSPRCLGVSAGPSWPVSMCLPRCVARSSHHVASHERVGCCCPPVPWRPASSAPPAALVRRWRHAALRCAAWATRAHASSAVSGTVVDREASMCTPASWARSRERLTVNTASSPGGRRWGLEPPRRWTTAPPRGPCAPARTVRRRPAPSARACLQAMTLCQGRGGGRPWGGATFDEMTRSEAVGTLVLTNTPQ
jgi:hypothetical protein